MRKTVSKRSTHPKLRIMMVTPSADYFEWGAAMVKMLTDAGRSGVYVSFHRPFENVVKVLKHYGVNTNKLFFVDVATGVTGTKIKKNLKCVHVPKADPVLIDNAVHKLLKKLNGTKFIFVDSLTLHSFYKPVSETKRLSKLLIERIDNEHANYIVFNVASELADLGFIKSLSKDVDEVIVMPQKTG